MYICICNALKDRDVAQAAADGARNAAEVFRAHGCRARCGVCVSHVRTAVAAMREAPRRTAGSRKVEATGGLEMGSLVPAKPS